MCQLILGVSFKKMKRDILKEIESKRNRFSKRRSAYKQAHERLMALIYSKFHLMPLSNKNKEVKNELIRYFSVGLISCIEGYFRIIIKEMIDYGSPFRDNAHKLEDLKLNLQLITNLYDKKISIGEIISHLVKISSFNDIQKHMSVLFGYDYFSKIKQMVVIEPKTYDEFQPRAYEILNKTFEDRHIACHELNPKKQWKYKTIEEQWRVVFHTIMANELVLKEIYNHSPKS